MRDLGIYRHSTIIITTIVVCIFLLTKCVNDSGKKMNEQNDGDFRKFAGSEVCADCHRDIYEKHLKTEHHFSSRPANDSSIMGSFEVGKNVFVFNPSTSVIMEKRDSGFYQVEYSNVREIRKGRFDIVVGSGRKGQSYLNWINNRLVQLPITYFTAADQWSNSPGYVPYKPLFYRPITSRCLECHSTYFKKISENSQKLEDFDHREIIYGVDCEKCHGPAAAHVEFQKKNPGIKEAKFIVDPGKLSRDRLLDLCALCHGGQLTKTKPSFQFQAGDTLTNYFNFNPVDSDIANIDVHGNQLGLLSLSKCFTIGKITCINCHNVHENEYGQVSLFSQRCQTCHSKGHEETCKMVAAIGPSITQNCIDCHMPKQPSLAIAVYLQGANTPTPALLRTHLIKVYPDETKKFLNLMKHQKSN